jgi:transcriptional regulator with XRE-family HTH domain
VASTEQEALDRDGSPVREFAFWLRDLKRASDLTYEQLARRTGYGVSTLQEACGGRRLPTLKVARAIAGACGADVPAWESYWQDVRRAADPSAPSPVRVSPPWAEPPPEADPAPGRALPGEPDPDQGVPGGAGPVAASAPGGARDARAGRRGLSPGRGGGVAAAVAVGVLAVLVAAVVLVRVQRPGRAAAPAARTWTETTGTAARTWSDYRVAGGRSGEALGPRESVQVSCRVRGYVVPDGDPWWYRIESPPWNGDYYATSDAFYNEGSTSGPVDTGVVVDEHVPEC